VVAATLKQEDRSQKTEDRSQDYAEAVAILRQASALAPEEQTIREHYGLALYYAKQYREAASVLERLINSPVVSGPSSVAKDNGQRTTDNPYAKRADIRTALGECQMEMDQPRDARDNFELASQLEPGTATVWLNLAKAALRLNDLKRAELSLKKASSIDPKSADANLLMGYLNLKQSEDVKREDVKQQKLQEALGSFRTATKLYGGAEDKASLVSVCMTGLVLEKMGRSTEAIGYYSQALKVKPNDELATSLLAKVQVKE